MKKNRGVWGSGDSHGSAVQILPVIKHLRFIKSEGRWPPHVSHSNLTRHFPHFFTDSELTLEGEKFLARVTYLIPFV